MFLMIVEVLAVNCCPFYLPGVPIDTLYVWSSKVEVSILTNFWQFMVVDVYLVC